MQRKVADSIPERDTEAAAQQESFFFFFKCPDTLLERGMLFALWFACAGLKAAAIQGCRLLNPNYINS